MRPSSLVGLASCLALACGPAVVPADAAPVDGALPVDAAMEDAGSDAGPPTLRADAGPAVFGHVGDEITLDGSRSTLAVEYEWWPGDGVRLARGADPIARVRYAAPGRFSATLIVYDAEGLLRTDNVVVTIVRRPVFEPRQSSTLATTPFTGADGLGRLAVVSPDSDEIVFVAIDPVTGPGAVVRRVTVCDHPRTVTALGGSYVAVACQDDDTVVVVPIETGEPTSLRLPRGSRPFAVLAVDDTTLVASLQGTGELAVITYDGAFTLRRVPAVEDARALALLPDGRVVVSRWRSLDGGGELVVIDLATGARTTIALAVDPQVGSDTEIGGVPSYLESIAVSPDGSLLAVASLQASLSEGTFRSGRALRFDTAIRATVSFVDVATETELFARRRQLDNRGFASAALFSPLGDFLYVATRGNRTIERIDVLADSASGSLQDLGYALDGLALVNGGGVLAVDAFLSREVVVIRTEGLDGLEVTSRAPIVETEPLTPELLLGSRLFNDSADTRLGADGYMACAHCHLDGLDDHRTWDFTDRGEGLRNTVELVGRAGASHGPIHWSANFDEIQDFESDMRNAFGGTGLLADDAWASHMTTLGTSRAGLSADLDALAAYVTSLGTFARSPFRDEDGTLPADAARGREIFGRASVRCAACHSGPTLTDSAFTAPGVPLLHDIATLGPASGMRLGGALTGIDTPTLHGVWATAPYLHDGSASTLRELFVERNTGDWHGQTTVLTTTELDDLVAYLRCLDGRAD